MKKIKILGFLALLVVLFVSCEKDRNYPETTFEIKVLDEFNKPIVDSTLTIFAAWGTTFYDFKEDSRTLVLNKSGEASGKLKITKRTFEMKIRYYNFSKMGSLEASKLKPKFVVDSIFNKASLKFNKGVFKVGKVNKIVLVRAKN